MEYLNYNPWCTRSKLILTLVWLILILRLNIKVKIN